MLSSTDKMFDSFPETICTQVDTESPFDALSIPHSEMVNITKVNDSLPLCDMEQSVTEKKQPKGRVRWTVSETLTLINAKQAEMHAQSPGYFLKQNKSAIEKWKTTSAQCHSNGLHRTAAQCRDRWDHIQPDYKRIRQYERTISSSHESYWNLTVKERTDRNLPANFTREIFDAMENHFGQNRIINPGDMVIDTSASNYASIDTNFCHEEASSHKDMKLESYLDAQGNGFIDGGASTHQHKSASGKKRKFPSATSGIKSALAENCKKLVSSMKLGELGHLKRHEKYCSMLERKMEIDDKYLKDHALNLQKMIFIEEQKVKVQHELISALNTIGQAMLKISESLERE